MPRPLLQSSNNLFYPPSDATGCTNIHDGGQGEVTHTLITHEIHLGPIEKLSLIAKMDVASAVSGYMSKMVSAGDSALGSSSSKMKILLLDSETVRV